MTAWRRYLQRQERRVERRALRAVNALISTTKPWKFAGLPVVPDLSVSPGTFRVVPGPFYRHPDGSWQKKPA